MRKILFFTICFLFLNHYLHAQTIRVTGKIIDPNGDPIANATIVEKGTKNGIVAQNDGTFSIPVKSAKSLLVITALGYEAKQVSISSDPLSVTLSLDTKTLSEVVVTGVGIATSRVYCRKQITPDTWCIA